MQVAYFLCENYLHFSFLWFQHTLYFRKFSSFLRFPHLEIVLSRLRGYLWSTAGDKVVFDPVSGLHGVYTKRCMFASGSNNLTTKRYCQDNRNKFACSLFSHTEGALTDNWQTEEQRRPKRCEESNTVYFLHLR